MPIVTTDQVHAFLSSPPWSNAQWESVERIIAHRESSLESLLGVPITPVERIERASILESGLLATSAPVHTVHEINDVAPLAGAELPDGYRRRDRYWVTTATPPTGGFTLTGGRATYYGAVLIRYDAGWGSHPQLVGAIIEKSAGVARNRHDDTVTTSGLDAEALPPAEEGWTDAELTSLHRFKLARLK